MITRSKPNYTNLEVTTAQTLQKLHSWFADSNLLLNLDKESLHFTLKKAEANRTIRSFGMNLDTRLGWKAHTYQIYQINCQQLFFLTVAGSTLLESQ